MSKHLSEPDIRKTDRSKTPDVDTKAAYKSIQKGGEIPRSGLGKSYLEKRGRLCR